MEISKRCFSLRWSKTARKGRHYHATHLRAKLCPNCAHIARLTRTSMLKLAYTRVPSFTTFDYLRQLTVLSMHQVNSFRLKVSSQLLLIGPVQSNGICFLEFPLLFELNRISGDITSSGLAFPHVATVRGPSEHGKARSLAHVEPASGNFPVRDA